MFFFDESTASFSQEHIKIKPAITITLSKGLVFKIKEGPFVSQLEN